MLSVKLFHLRWLDFGITFMFYSNSSCYNGCPGKKSFHEGEQTFTLLFQSVDDLLGVRVFC